MSYLSRGVPIPSFGSQQGGDEAVALARKVTTSKITDLVTWTAANTQVFALDRVKQECSQCRQWQATYLGHGRQCVCSAAAVESQDGPGMGAGGRGRRGPGDVGPVVG